MSDLIDRQAVIDVIDAILPVEPMKNEYTQGITCGAALAIEYVKQLPSAQPEIIHCRDCKYYTPVTARCEVRGKGLYLIRNMEDFCSRAEPYKGEQE